MKGSMIIHPDELSAVWIDRLADLGIDTLGIHPVGGASAAASLADLLRLSGTVEYRELIDYAHSRGLEVEYELHAAGYLLPRDLFAEHPEYFRVNGQGERVADHNFCVSSREALELVARRSAELAEALYGSCDRFYFWMDDGHDLFCHCEKCKRFSPSDQQMTVINRMIRQIRKRKPRASLAYLAYMDSIVPPSISAEDGVFLEYAPFEKYTAKGDNAHELIRRERQMISPLMAHFGSGPRKVLEYWYDNSLYSNWQKPPKKFHLDSEGMEKDIREYSELKFDTVSTFACFLGSDYEMLHGQIDIAPFAKALKNLDPA